MAYEVTEPTIELHDENKFYHGSIQSIELEDGNFGPQLKWIIHLDGETYEKDGKVNKKETWTWCSPKLTTHEKNKFRKYVKGLKGSEPKVGELFDEKHWTLDYYSNNPEADPEVLTGKSEPWRVAVMFEHGKKADGSPKESVNILVTESNIK